MHYTETRIQTIIYFPVITIKLYYTRSATESTLFLRPNYSLHLDSSGSLTESLKSKLHDLYQKVKPITYI